jgi:hypothetical protein
MSIFNTIIRLLSFQLTREEMLQFQPRHFFVGLAGTWIVGMGRYWDDNKASALQHAGLGSVAYIFVLAAFIWLIILPFKIEGWNYFRVLTFISLTSFPAIFYAIPVERFFALSTANTMNVWFLAVVAAWRLALLKNFLGRFTMLRGRDILTMTLMPICVIITTLTFLNLHKVVFEVMGGVRNPSPHDAAYSILLILTGISMILTLPLLIGYGEAIYSRRKSLRAQKGD